MVNKDLKYLFRFALVGVINTAVDISVFITLLSLLNLSAVLSHIAAFLTAVIVSFLLNRSWTFKNSAKKPRGKAFMPFLAICLCALTASSLTLILLVQFMPALMAKFFAILVSFSINFLGSRILFLSRPRQI